MPGSQPATLLNKRLWYRCFPVDFAKFLKTSFSIENLWFSKFSYNLKLKTFREKFTPWTWYIGCTITLLLFDKTAKISLFIVLQNGIDTRRLIHVETTSSCVYGGTLILTSSFFLWMFSVNTHLKLSGFERSGIGPGKLETIIRGKFWS